MEIFQKMDWIHCNNCYMQPGDAESRKFSITNCGHIFCFNCADPEESRKCLLCQAPCCNVIISPKMSKELEIYFTEPFQILQRMVNILEFQKKHRIRLQTFRKKQLNILKNEILSVKEKLEQNEKKMASIHEGFKRIGTHLMEQQQELANLKQNGPSGNSPILKGSHSNNRVGKKLTPQSRMDASENKRNILKRPPEGAKFFATSTPNAPQCDNTNDTFITPPSKRSGSQRGSNVFDSNSSNSDKWSPQRDPFFRKFKLPGDRGGPPGSVTALHRLNLSKQPLKARKCKMDNTKYSEYFK